MEVALTGSAPYDRNADNERLRVTRQGRAIVIGAALLLTVALLFVVYLGDVTAGPHTAPAADRPPPKSQGVTRPNDEALPEKCDGKAVDVYATSDDSATRGSEGDDVVVFTEGAWYQSGGGTDVVCNAEGIVEAIVHTDDAGPSEPRDELPQEPRHPSEV
jgi:hypothetical protein